MSSWLEKQTPYNEQLSRRTNTTKLAAVQKNKRHTMSSCPEEQTPYSEQLSRRTNAIQ
jgi:hypothetical protein